MPRPIKENSIKIFSCYFGRLPWYFSYFVYSCKFNPTVDFCFITDDQTEFINGSSNLQVIYKSLKEINDLASKKLGFQVNIPNGYKLCDFKPTYGLIFSDLFEEYAFWGHCDIDIILGDIRRFFTDELLSNYDIFSVRHDWLSGCFMLYRNNEILNQLFQQSCDFKKVLSSRKHFCFDETNFAHDAFSNGEHFSTVKTEVESMTHVVLRLQEKGQVRVFFDFLIIEGTPGNLKWQNGKMYFKRQFEILFYHLIIFKRNFAFRKKLNSNPNEFNISSKQIHSLKS